MKRRLIKNGNSVALVIPKTILSLLGLKVNDEIELTIKKDTIIVSKGE
jgi:antitoxin component of MazEF toxin-antitoxin module